MSQQPGWCPAAKPDHGFMKGGDLPWHSALSRKLGSTHAWTLCAVGTLACRPAQSEVHRFGITRRAYWGDSCTELDRIASILINGQPCHFTKGTQDAGFGPHAKQTDREHDTGHYTGRLSPPGLANPPNLSAICCNLSACIKDAGIAMRHSRGYSPVP